MSCKPLKSVNFRSFEVPADVLRALQSELLELMKNAETVDFNNEEDVDQFSRNILFIKGYYERYETLIRTGNNC
jgi:hypothetical protein